MIIHLVRHGETSHNRDGLGLGRADPVLTDLGLLQAAAVAERLACEPVTRILSSPLSRALQTARMVAGERGIAVEMRHELIELDAGETDGMPLAELRDRHPGFFEKWLGPDAAEVPLPGGESLRDVARRLPPLVSELRDPADGTSVLVAHNFVLKALICELLELDLGRFRNIATDLASVSTITVTARRVSAVVLNDCCHLHRLSLDPQQRRF